MKSSTFNCSIVDSFRNFMTEKASDRLKTKTNLIIKLEHLQYFVREILAGILNRIYLPLCLRSHLCKYNLQFYIKSTQSQMVMTCCFFLCCFLSTCEKTNIISNISYFLQTYSGLQTLIFLKTRDHSGVNDIIPTQLEEVFF